MIPIPSFKDIKTAYEVVMKAIGFIKQIQKDFEPTQSVSSETVLYRPGRDHVIEKILGGKFPRIPGIYDVLINEKQRFIEVEADVVDMEVSWKFRDRGERVWWSLPESDISQVNWVELVEVTYQ